MQFDDNGPRVFETRYDQQLGDSMQGGSQQTIINWLRASRDADYFKHHEPRTASEQHRGRALRLGDLMSPPYALISVIALAADRPLLEHEQGRDADTTSLLALAAEALSSLEKQSRSRFDRLRSDWGTTAHRIEFRALLPNGSAEARAVVLERNYDRNTLYNQVLGMQLANAESARRMNVALAASTAHMQQLNTPLATRVKVALHAMVGVVWQWQLSDADIQSRSVQLVEQQLHCGVDEYRRAVEWAAAPNPLQHLGYAMVPVNNPTWLEVLTLKKLANSVLSGKKRGLESTFTACKQPRLAASTAQPPRFDASCMRVVTNGEVVVDLHSMATVAGNTISATAFAPSYKRGFNALRSFAEAQHLQLKPNDRKTTTRLVYSTKEQHVARLVVGAHSRAEEAARHAFSVWYG